MSTDASIRRVSISEQAEAAARRFVETGEASPNPGTLIGAFSADANRRAEERQYQRSAIRDRKSGKGAA